MTARAFVIAIQNYSKGKSLPSLPGTNKDAETFIQWLVDKKGVKRSDIVCCADKKVKGRTTGTTSEEIIKALAKAGKDWANKTDEFYFYFSGHGFSYSASAFEKPIDVLVASDFSDPATSGRACLELDEIKAKLWKALGPHHHYYFIDACRNEIPGDAIDPSGTGLGFPNSERGTPTVYKLFSTADGAVSKTDSGFTPLLVKGLSGGGRAKGLRSNRMYVIFDLLGSYMKKELQAAGQTVDFSHEGNGDGFLLELKPIPESKCEIKIAKAKPSDEFVLTIQAANGMQKKKTFKGSSFEFTIFPDDYSFQLSHPFAKLLRKPPPEDPVDLYDPCVLNFELQAPAKTAKTTKAATKKGKTSKVVLPLPLVSDGGRGKALLAAVPAATVTGTLNLKGPTAPHTEIEVQNLRTGELERVEGDFHKEVAPGDYLVKLRERGVTISKHEVTVQPGKTKTIDLAARPKDKVRTSILKAVKAKEKGANQDLGLWLSLLGASRILGQAGQFKQLPLQTFKDLKKNETVVYVLAGFEKTSGSFAVGLSSGPDVKWQLLKKVKGLEKIYELRLPATPGSHLLSLKVPKRPAITFATHCLPNRATLATFAQDKEGRLTFHQSILPIKHLAKYLDPTVQGYLHGNMLDVVRTMTLAQSQFARKRSVREQLEKSDRKVWKDLVNHKWLDPLMALIAAYDVIRHGTRKEARGLLEMVNSNLKKHFEGMGDVEAIAKLLGSPWKMPASPPVFLDGVMAFDEIQEKQMLPLSPDKLDYYSPWTAWQRAVNDFESPRAKTRKRSKGRK
jgi:caspase domain-containing protein